MKTVLKRIGYVIKYKDISDDILNNIKDELTVQPYTNPEFNGSVEKFKLYIKKKNKIIVPRYYGVKKFGKPTKNKLGNFEKNNNLNFVYSLRENQKPAIDACLKDFDINGGCLLCAGCGFGKTSCSLYLACQLKVKTLVIVHKHFLLNQWIESIKKFVPNAKVGTIRGKTIDIEDKDIVIGMLQSISMKDYDKNIFKDFGLTIVDECHHISSEVFSQALPKISTKYMLGLTATPNRKDGLAKVFKWYLGDIAYKVSSMKSFEVLVKSIKFKSSNYSYSKEERNFKNQIIMPTMINNICNYILLQKL